MALPVLVEGVHSSTRICVVLYAFNLYSKWQMLMSFAIRILAYRFTHPIVCICVDLVYIFTWNASKQKLLNKYFELKNSWGVRAPLNLELLASNFPMYVQ